MPLETGKRGRNLRTAVAGHMVVPGTMLKPLVAGQILVDLGREPAEDALVQLALSTVNFSCGWQCLIFCRRLMSIRRTGILPGLRS